MIVIEQYGKYEFLNCPNFSVALYICIDDGTPKKKKKLCIPIDKYCSKIIKHITRNVGFRFSLLFI